MQIDLIGMGMGSALLLTGEARAALALAQVLIGSPRMLELCADWDCPHHAAVGAREIAGILDRLRNTARAAVLLSGDVGFYSGAAGLLPLLEGHTVRCVPGVSSPQYLAARLGRSWQDWHLASAHAGQVDAPRLVRLHRSVFFLCGSQTCAQLCGALADAGLGMLEGIAAERLGTPDEQVTCLPVAQLAALSFQQLSVLLVENPGAVCRTPRPEAGGLRDELFLRDKAPMTKAEVRAVVRAKLGICPGDVVWDIGAGTGSVAIEAAVCAGAGAVYAVERDTARCALVERNRAHLGADAVRVVRGDAPEALAGLPVPDRVFIGGSGGALVRILEAVAHQNPRARVVVAAVTLETLSDAVGTLERAGFGEAEAVQVAVTRFERVGGYRMARAQNPVFLISAGGEKQTC